MFELGRPRLRLGPKAAACPDTKKNTTSRCFEIPRYRSRPRSQTPRAPTPNQTQWFSTMPRSFSTSFDILFDSGRLALGWKFLYATEKLGIESSRWFGNLPIPFSTQVKNALGVQIRLNTMVLNYPKIVFDLERPRFQPRSNGTLGPDLF